MGIQGNRAVFDKLIEEMVSAICPGSISLHMSRFDTKSNHPHKAIYEADKSYLATTQQSSFIRAARCGECDYSPSNDPFMERYPQLVFQSATMPNKLVKAMWKEIPRLWVLVTNMGDGAHHVGAIYRGRPLWKVIDRDGAETAHFKSDLDFTNALSAIQQCEGFDTKAWELFCQRYWDTCVFEAAADQTKDQVQH